MMKGKKVGNCLRCSYEFQKKFKISASGCEFQKKFKISASGCEFQKKFKIRFFLLFLLGVGVFFSAFVSAGKGDYDSTFGDGGGSSYDVPSNGGSKVVGTPDTRSSSDSTPVPSGNGSKIVGNPNQDQANSADKAKKDSAKQEPAKKEKKSPSETGINVDTDCLVNGGCSFSIYDALDIRKDRATGERTSVMTFLNDIILGLTWFIGTVVTVAFLLSGFYYIISPVESGAKKKASEGMKYALIGMFVVSLSVVIVRLVQFLAKGGT